MLTWRPIYCARDRVMDLFFIGVISNHFNSWNNWVFMIYTQFVKFDFNMFRDDNGVGVGHLDIANHGNLSCPSLSSRSKIDWNEDILMRWSNINEWEWKKIVVSSLRRERETSVIIKYINTLGNQDRIGKIVWENL